MDKNARLRELTETLNRASKAYYAEDAEIMSNYEYDRLYDELAELESSTGIVLEDSPTRRVGYEAVDELPKERHASPMLSLDKTKDREALKSWLNGQDALLSWKLDGLTIVLTYDNGELSKAVTRGNGEVGEVITPNAKTFVNIPLSIPFKGILILRGEAVIGYKDFEQINESIADAGSRYKNPRNLCSGSVRQLNSAVTAKRHVRFFAFTLVSADGVDFGGRRHKQLEFLAEQGFDVVEYHHVTPDTIIDTIERFAQSVGSYDIPSDGLVLTLDDLEYASGLGMTSKFPRDSIAFKWADETQETTLLEMEWSPSRTGLINPVAIFSPVELEGTTVSRASVHNISIIESLELGIGDRITVYKANMIIPQIADNLTRSGNLPIPDRCPACNGPVKIANDNGTKTLVCTDSECSAKKIKSFCLFVGRDAMQIDGLSEATLEKFIGRGMIHEYADIYRLERFRDEICEMEGFGERSFDNLLKSIEKSRDTEPARLIYSLGIPNVGLANAKVLCRFFDQDIDRIRKADIETLSAIDGIGEVIAGSIVSFFENDRNNTVLDDLREYLRIHLPESPGGEAHLSGMTFVITGSLEHYSNRNELKDVIENLGGKVAGSVSSNTTCLINNDVASASSKNRKARELGIPVVSEGDFIRDYLKQE
ncbi:MAG: NAD-dependent DNA ligase LigA [Lachnospiraceae bacterium]|nr:NAD-dependent DNA ligase LigA [Lachnospiraceae bacterium]